MPDKSDIWQIAAIEGDDFDDVLDYMIQRYLGLGGDPTLIIEDRSHEESDSDA